MFGYCHEVHLNVVYFFNLVLNLSNILQASLLLQAFFRILCSFLYYFVFWVEERLDFLLCL